jgi:hypothetical protein
MRTLEKAFRSLPTPTSFVFSLSFFRLLYLFLFKWLFTNFSPLSLTVPPSTRRERVRRVPEYQEVSQMWPTFGTQDILSLDDVLLQVWFLFRVWQNLLWTSLGPL